MGKSTEALNQGFKDIKDQLDRIEYKQDCTNGRVRKLEIWRGYITGAIAILSIIVLPVALIVIKQFLSNI